MSYTSIAISTTDPALVARIRACTMQEAQRRDDTFAAACRANPDHALSLVWPVCTAADVAAAYASALAAGHPDPGGDEAVITDQAILSNVQAAWPPDTKDTNR